MPKTQGFYISDTMYIIHSIIKVIKMIEIECQTKKWGNSLACIIPSEIVEKKRLKENQSIKLILEDKSNVLSETFGILKQWKTPTKKLMRKLDKELWNE